MFIRRTVSKSKKYNDEKYYTYRLVESYRLNGKVKQRVLLNLGSDFNIDKAENYGNHHPTPPIPAKDCISCQVSSDISNSFLSLNAFWAINSTFKPSKKKYLVTLSFPFPI